MATALTVRAPSLAKEDAPPPPPAPGSAPPYAGPAAGFTVSDFQAGCIPCGTSGVRISDLELELTRTEAPFNIICCAARAVETTHLAHVRLLRVARGARSCRQLCAYLGAAALVGVVVGLGLGAARGLSRDGMIGAGAGVGAAVFAVLFLVWLFARSAFFSFATDGAEARPLEGAAAGADMRIAAPDAEAVLSAAWAAWSRFRAALAFDVAAATAEGGAGHVATVRHSSCCVPLGHETLSIVERRQVLIKKSAGFCDLAAFSAATWEGFWSDDIKWVQYTRGNRSLRGFYACIIAGLAAGLATGFAPRQTTCTRANPYSLLETCTKTPSDSDSQTYAIIAGVLVFLFCALIWFLLGKTQLAFGLTATEVPNLQVPRATASELYDAAAGALLRRDADLAPLAGVGVISGLDATGNAVELRVSADVAEVRTYDAKSWLQKTVCWLCTNEAAYRCRTSDLAFVFSAIESIVVAAWLSAAIFIVGSAVTVIVATITYAKDDDAQTRERARAIAIGVGISAAIAIVRLLLAMWRRKSVVVLGTPLQRRAPPSVRLLDAMGLVPAPMRYLYFVEFRALGRSPEQTVALIAAAVRAAREKSAPFPPPAPRASGEVAPAFNPPPPAAAAVVEPPAGSAPAPSAALSVNVYKDV